MNAIMWSPAQARALSNLELVREFEHVAAENRESDCRSALQVLRVELLPRLVLVKP